MKKVFRIVSLFVGALMFVFLIFAVSLIGHGQRRLGPLETIHGIPYSRDDKSIHVDEPLAHADVYLGQPVFGKKLVLTLEVIPTDIKSLSVGVRENSFWLSYTKIDLVGSDHLQATSYKLQTAIPLTDKLQEGDQSVDLMFFAEGEDPGWELVSLDATVEYDWPSWLEFKDYAKAILYRERAL